MNYKLPFYAVSKAIYNALSKKEQLEWFDSAVPIEEIEDYFKKQAEFAYGIFGAANADCVANKNMATWDTSINLEVYSNYKGRKVVAQKLEQLLNYLSSDAGWELLQKSLNGEGFALISMNVGTMRLNLPIYSDNGVWQSGSTSVIFRVGQLKERK